MNIFFRTVSSLKQKTALAPPSGEQPSSCITPPATPSDDEFDQDDQLELDDEDSVNDSSPAHQPKSSIQQHEPQPSTSAVPKISALKQVHSQHST